jgi:hypothetical protein
MLSWLASDGECYAGILYKMVSNILGDDGDSGYLSRLVRRTGLGSEGSTTL